MQITLTFQHICIDCGAIVGVASDGPKYKNGRWIFEVASCEKCNQAQQEDSADIIRCTCWDDGKSPSKIHEEGCPILSR